MTPLQEKLLSRKLGVGAVLIWLLNEAQRFELMTIVGVTLILVEGVLALPERWFKARDARGEPAE